MLLNPNPFLLTILLTLLLYFSSFLYAAQKTTKIKNNKETIDYRNNTKCKVFIQHMVAKHQFERKELQKLFSRINKRKKQKILTSIKKPAEKVLQWSSYQNLFLHERLYRLGEEFYAKYHKILKSAEKKYGVDYEIIMAIIAVESGFGINKGKFNVLDTLSLLSFGKQIRRQKFYTKELESFLIFSRNNKQDPRSIKGSYSGAMGIVQFIPSSVLHYAVDFDGDKKIDLLNNFHDAIGSTANYLKKCGWRLHEIIATEGELSAASKKKGFTPYLNLSEIKNTGVKPKKKLPKYLDNHRSRLVVLQGEKKVEYWLTFRNYYVITRYNRSDLYAMSVFHYAKEIKRRLKKSSRK